MARSCPRCNVGMKMEDRLGVEIDKCQKCLGIWFDNNELDKLSGGKALEGLIFTARVLGKELKCPACATDMQYMTVEDVTIDPVEPKVLDTVTITATITSDEEIDEVTLRIKECDESMCMQTESYEMDLDDGKYTVTDDLTFAGATYFGYQFVITIDGNETETEFVNVTLQPADNGGTNGGNGGDGDGDNGIPGFELIPLFVATLIVIFYLRRKRSR